MFKLYSQSTQQIKLYPRNDHESIVGLDSDYLVLTQIETPPPEYNPETEQVSSEWIIDLDNLEYRQEWIVTPIPELPVANWDNFNLQMMSDTRFNQVYSQCLSVAPIVANALPTALDQVTSKGTSLFTLIWNQLCSIGGATVEDREIWANYGIDNNLPLEFIDILRGNNA